MAQIVGLLLAAGQGRRFGSDKLLHPLDDGTPLAVASARKLKEACPRAIAVLRPEQTTLAALLIAEGLEVVICPEASAGMGHSLAAGVAASLEAAGWLVALADMPFVQVATLRSVADALATGAALAAPFHNSQRGHPVAFAARWRDQLLALTGDEGARAVVGNNRGLLSRIDTADAGVLRDVDTPQDLALAVHSP
ncbi:nucleotidyltransferase family protein [Zoogloea oleivorans]|uniref:Nucleotidyltransferase family protein n=1 Tax=Zoogloea oleivorans TaxID=1552750 RepID=A0A6C2D513_9RHOO|nr:nucleotidyltransferase family protein [Zoogloea oleivorans]TYC61417.1 nucleotidyltransferase family protein [Zoogloea oleivorans]